MDDRETDRWVLWLTILQFALSLIAGAAFVWISLVITRDVDRLERVLDRLDQRLTLLEVQFETRDRLP
jgi:hypothetical protein